MGRIQVLSDLLANKIAAGEVVERPASVIKELLENAVDAEATEIVVEIEQGGLDLIKVADNGIGMDPDDALTAFERHATSKIRSEKDLFRIRTLGFRGEALPSIASVAKVEVKSRTREASEGTLVKIEGGKLITHGVTAAKKGTEFAVRDLFFNTPARLKYMKSLQTETGHILDCINRVALAHPEIGFRFCQNGRHVLQTPGDGNLLHAVAAIYGHDVARQMLAVEWEDYDYKITGAVGYPELNRANRSHCSFFVNGRYVKSYQLLNAVQAAYHTRLPINRYPVCVIALELDPSLVDVNVHPNKLEVRFSEDKDVMRAVQAAVEGVLNRQTFIPKATARGFEEPKEKTRQHKFDLQVPGSSRQENLFTPPGANGPQTREPLPQGGAVRRETPLPAKRENTPLPQQIDAALGAYRRPEDRPQPHGGSVREPGAAYTAPSNPDQADFARTTGPQGGTDPQKGASPQGGTNLQNGASPQSEASPQGEADVPGVSTRRVPQFQPVAQVLGMYVIAQDDSGLFIIDQHAAHEKVLYEKFNRRLIERDIQPLPLLVPLTFELTASEAAHFEQKIPVLADCRIEVDSFGGTTFLVRSVPDIWEGLQVQGMLQELIDELLQEGAAPDPRKLIENKVITKACKSAIKANHWLSMPEMVALCDQLRELDNPFTCPHGRPIIIHMSAYDLEKQFKRVM